jgi:hypothetical protein
MLRVKVHDTLCLQHKSVWGLTGYGLASQAGLYIVHKKSKYKKVSYHLFIYKKKFCVKKACLLQYYVSVLSSCSFKCPTYPTLTDYRAYLNCYSPSARGLLFTRRVTKFLQGLSYAEFPIERRGIGKVEEMEEGEGKRKGRERGHQSMGACPTKMTSPKKSPSSANRRDFVKLTSKNK